MHSFRIKAVAKKYLRRAYFKEGSCGFEWKEHHFRWYKVAKNLSWAFAVHADFPIACLSAVRCDGNDFFHSNGRLTVGLVPEICPPWDRGPIWVVSGRGTSTYYGWFHQILE